MSTKYGYEGRWRQVDMDGDGGKPKNKLMPFRWWFRCIEVAWMSQGDGGGGSGGGDGGGRVRVVDTYVR